MSLTTVERVARTPLNGTFVQLLLRGLLAGLVAGLLAGGVAYATGEQHIDAAISIEEAHAAEAPLSPSDQHDAAAPAPAPAEHSHEAPLVSRDGQRAGLILATALTGVAFGAVFATVLAVARTRTRLSGLSLVGAVGAAGWFAIAAVPFLKYPANPPAVGDPDTISQRTWLWVAAVGLGLCAVAAHILVRRYLDERLQWATFRAVLPVAAAVAVVAIGYAVLPPIDEVGADFPASLLWQFRLSSALTQLTLWALLATSFAVLTEASIRRKAH